MKGKPEETMARRWRASMLRFLGVELQAAEIFLKLAINPCNHSERANYIVLAREAYDTAIHFCERIPMSVSDRRRLGEIVDRVKGRLEEVGAFYEEFDEPIAIPQGSAPRRVEEPLSTAATGMKNVGERVEGFVRLCEKTRADAQRMLAINQATMRARPPREARP